MFTVDEVLQRTFQGLSIEKGVHKLTPRQVVGFQDEDQDHRTLQCGGMTHDAYIVRKIGRQHWFFSYGVGCVHISQSFSSWLVGGIVKKPSDASKIMRSFQGSLQYSLMLGLHSQLLNVPQLTKIGYSAQVVEPYELTRAALYRAFQECCPECFDNNCVCTRCNILIPNSRQPYIKVTRGFSSELPSLLSRCIVRVLENIQI